MTKQEKRRLSRFSIVKQLTKRVRKEYIKHRRLWRGSRDGDQQHYKPGERDEICFERLAEMLYAAEIMDVEAFMQVQFGRDREYLSHVPQPKQLCGPAALKRWFDHVETTAANENREIKLTLGVNLERFSVELHRTIAMGRPLGWSLLDAVRYVLLDPESRLSGLFRYSMAVQHHLTDVAEQFYAAAMLEYGTNRQLYDEVWAEAISNELKQAASVGTAGTSAAEAIQGVD